MKSAPSLCTLFLKQSRYGMLTAAEPSPGCRSFPLSPEISPTIWQKAAFYGITEFPHNS